MVKHVVNYHRVNMDVVPYPMPFVVMIIYIVVLMDIHVMLNIHDVKKVLREIRPIQFVPMVRHRVRMMKHVVKYRRTVRVVVLYPMLFVVVIKFIVVLRDIDAKLKMIDVLNNLFNRKKKKNENLFEWQKMKQNFSQFNRNRSKQKNSFLLKNHFELKSNRKKFVIFLIRNSI